MVSRILWKFQGFCKLPRNVFKMMLPTQHLGALMPRPEKDFKKSLQMFDYFMKNIATSNGRYYVSFMVFDCDGVNEGSTCWAYGRPCHLTTHSHMLGGDGVPPTSQSAQTCWSQDPAHVVPVSLHPLRSPTGKLHQYWRGGSPQQETL